MIRLADTLGSWILSLCEEIGDFSLFFYRALRIMFSTRPKPRQIILHMYHIGIGSFVIVFLTGSFTGLALALQSYIGFHRVGADDFIGLVVALGMVRELGPVLTGLMITGRCGSAMTAEIGSMQITEQVDALKTVNINPYHYLIVPRLIASTIIMPFLSIFSMICGIIGGYIFCIHVLGLNAETYVAMIQQHTSLSDIAGGLIKSAFFGLIFAWVGTYNGYITTGGARGVGIATTRSVVMGSILILAANYFLSSILFQTGVS